MKKLLGIIAIVSLMALTGCSITERTKDLPLQGGDEEVSDYIGLTVEEATELAEENDVMFRVVERDGEPLPATMDYRPGRINASVEDGMVISYMVEGGSDLPMDSSEDENRDISALEVEYSCDGESKFIVYYNEYSDGDTAMLLNEGVVMLKDLQEDKVYTLSQVESASGEKYESEDGLIFRATNGEASVWNGETEKYMNCQG